MKQDRREFLFQTVALSALTLGLRDASAQDGLSGTEQFSKQYGTRDLRSSLPNLQFLQQIQENKISVERSIEKTRQEISSSPLMQKLLEGGRPDLYHLYQWHSFALDLIAEDHTRIDDNKFDQTFGEQNGPTRSSRALAIFHLAVFEAINIIFRRANSYRGVQEGIYISAGILRDEKLPTTSANILPLSEINPSTVSVQSAIAYAAYNVLSVLFPRKEVRTRILFKELMLRIRLEDTEIARSRGAAIGEQAAQAVLSLRGFNFANRRFYDGSLDGFQRVDQTSIDLEPMADRYRRDGDDAWRPDPISGLTVALGGRWSEVEPFVLTEQQIKVDLLPVAPPKPGTPEFAKALDDPMEGVRVLGGDPDPHQSGTRNVTSTSRMGEVLPKPDATNDDLLANQSFIGVFWAYDGTALLCAPPRLYNMIATSIAFQEKPITNVEEFARYLAIINITMADACIAAWNAKYHYTYARPISFIRYGSALSGVAGIPNIRWTPLGAPVSNGKPDKANISPPFPAYPSGHAVFGAALFRAILRFHNDQTDDPSMKIPDEGISFKFVSDEYNGKNRSPDGKTRPLFQIQYPNFAKAVEDNAMSRIYLGIHWSFDAREGIVQGKKAADLIADTKFLAIKSS